MMTTDEDCNVSRKAPGKLLKKVVCLINQRFQLILQRKVTVVSMVTRRCPPAAKATSYSQQIIMATRTSNDPGERHSTSDERQMLSRTSFCLHFCQAPCHEEDLILDCLSDYAF